VCEWCGTLASVYVSKGWHDWSVYVKGEECGNINGVGVPYSGR